MTYQSLKDQPMEGPSHLDKSHHPAPSADQPMEGPSELDESGNPAPSSDQPMKEREEGREIERGREGWM